MVLIRRISEGIEGSDMGQLGVVDWVSDDYNLVVQWISFYLFEPAVIERIISRQSFIRYNLYEILYEFFATSWYFKVFIRRCVVLGIQYFLMQFRNLLAFEWLFPCQHKVYYTSYTPHINFLCVGLVLKHFRCLPLLHASFSHHMSVTKLFGYVEVNNFNLFEILW